MMNKDSPVLIIGMHRSGTSMLAGILNSLGVFMGEDDVLMEAQEKVNAKGFWEHKEVVGIHEEIFAYLGAGWNVSARFPKEWLDDSNVVLCKNKIVDIISAQFQGHGVWGVKDPRICRVLPLWDSIFTELELTPKYIHIIRHPYEVAKSLTKRDAYSVDYALMLWVRYILDATLYSSAKKCSYVTYEELNTNWRASMSRVSDEIDLAWPNSPDDADVATQIDDFVSVDLWHNRLNDEHDVVSEWGDIAVSLYAELMRLTKDCNDQQAKKNIEKLRISADAKFKLFDEICSPMMAHGSQYYSYTVKFQNENKILFDQREKLVEKVDWLARENNRLTNKIRNVLSLGLYGLVKFIVKSFKHD